MPDIENNLKADQPVAAVNQPPHKAGVPEPNTDIDRGLSLVKLAALLTKVPSMAEVGRSGIATLMREAGCSEEQIKHHVADLTTSEDPEAGQFGKKMPQSTLLVNMALESGTVLFHSPGGKTYASVGINSVLETFPVRSVDFRRYLCRLYFEKFRRVVGGQGIQDALNVLDAKARYEGVAEQVYCRVAQRDGAVYLDLANAERQIIAITPAGWEITTNVPVRFRRPKAMLALPTPVPRGNLVSGLKPFINANDSEFILIVAWLLSTLQPSGAYPILQIKGEQGSAKSTTSKLIRNLIDPNEAPARAQPREERDLVIALSNSHIGCFDNLSFIPEWLSDVFCRVSTGQSFSTRTLHTDEDESIFSVQRPIILNGIEELSTRGDLVDRSVIVDLPRIASDKRRTEDEFWAAFRNAHPAILGALLDTAAAAFANLTNVEAKNLPRMCDFARWAIAAEAHLGWPSGTFLSAYKRNNRDADLVALEASPVAGAILRFMDQGKREWKGTPSALLKELTQMNEVVAMRDVKHPAWPKTPHGLGNAIRRLAPSLRSAGLDVQCWKSGQRYIHLSRSGGAGDVTETGREGFGLT